MFTTACAAGMLAEKDADELRAAISQDLDCADVTAATRRVLTRGSSHDTCSQHAQHHEHCHICADATDWARPTPGEQTLAGTEIAWRGRRVRHGDGEGSVLRGCAA
ncbi:hypothetical protein [Streptomyces liliifuscus]|uniref:Uncharacterized protein n=1 Tax=Streptomyces liliifuscus TaxID=2797636 RepID=A0A7T7L388_9ACTN|nr:hypothetical protein [Streptomyces liliifuscus]QQM45648.1 hypothetical protein JEQ17_43705 [Streptomyces liliifuscus]